MAGELQINGEAVGPWKLVASAEDAGIVSTLSAYTTTQYDRLMFRIYVERATTINAFPYFYFLSDTGARRTDNYNNRVFISYGTGSFYSAEITGSIFSPGFPSSNLRYDTEDNANIFEILFFNIDSSGRHAGYLANWSYRTSVNVQVRGMGSGRKYQNVTTNPIYGIEATTNSTSYGLKKPKIEVYGDTTLT